MRAYPGTSELKRAETPFTRATREPASSGFVVQALACPVAACAALLLRSSNDSPNQTFQINRFPPESRRKTRNHGPFEAKDMRKMAESCPKEPEKFRVRFGCQVCACSLFSPHLCPVFPPRIKKLNVLPGVPRRSQALQPGPPRVKITHPDMVGTLGGRAQAPASQTWPVPSKRVNPPYILGFIIQSKTFAARALELAQTSFIPPERRNNYHKLSYMRTLSNGIVRKGKMGAQIKNVRFLNRSH
jgi:hypothetical protein